MARNTQITEKNLMDFPIGTKVRFNYGCMYGSEDGLIVDYRITQWGAFLIAETEDGTEKQISSFTEIGIGCYLIEKVAQ